MCDAGYTGASDYINLNAYEGSHCHINTTIVRLLWGILLFLTIVAAMNGWKYSEGARTKRKSKKKSKGTSHTLLFFACEASCALVTFLLCVVKVVSAQDQLIGIDALPTILFYFSRTLFYLMVYMMIQVLLGMTLGNKMLAKSAKGLGKAKKIFFHKLYAVDLMQCIFVFLPLFFEPGSSTVETLYVILNLFSAFALVGTLVAVKAAQKSIAVAFGGTTDKKITKLRIQFEKMAKEALVALIINVPLFVSFGVIKKAWKFWGYFIPVQYCLVMVVLIKLSKTAGGRSKKKKRVGPGAVTEASSGISSESGSSQSDGD